MHARFKLRRYIVLAERSQTLVAAAQLLVDDLFFLAEQQQSPELARLTAAYCNAIDDVKLGIRVGANLPPLLFRLEAIGREAATLLSGLRTALIDQRNAHPPNDASPAEPMAAMTTRPFCL